MRFRNFFRATSNGIIRRRSRKTSNADTPSISADLARRFLTQTRDLFGDAIYVDQDTLPAASLSLHRTLAAMEAAICTCQLCPLGRTRTRFVFGVGNPMARLVLVGEAPGHEEDLKGEPFVGRAGQKLNQILTAIGLQRSEIYICNVLKCRPPDNRAPHAEEIDTCMPYLLQQINLIQPRLIVALGNTAAHALLGVKSSLASMRSSLWKYGPFDLVVTYHPAALLRTPELRRPVWEDFKWIRSLLNKDLPNG